MSIAVVALLLAAAAYWFAVRPLPKTSGSMAAPVGGPATIVRDSLGVPHITASNWQDAIFLEGFVTAQDRLWQMDNLRRFAAGELAEIYGPKLIEQDRLARRMLMRQIAESYLQRCTTDERAILIEFARGVNFFINSRRGRYSIEFSLPHGYDPRPWTPTDTALVILSLFRDLTTSWKDDIARGELFRTATDPAKAEFLFPPTEGGYAAPGSNAWAVSGAHTYSGKPMLANDPHLAQSIPSILYMVHLECPGLDVAGATVPGLPGVIIGHNRDIAWGLTNMGADYQDVYEEQIDLRTGRYLSEGKQEQAVLNRQMLGVFGQSPVEVDTWITRHGPVLFGAEGKNYALRWSATDGFGYPILALDRAHNWQEFRAALKRFWGPAQNGVYADRNGHIGYQAIGAMPIRRGFSGNRPLDGASGKFEWQGYVPFEQLPSYYDPSSGMVSTANQNPFPADFPFPVEGHFAAPYRVRQIRARLQAKQHLTVKDMQAIQTDIYSAYDRFLARQVVAAFDRRHPDDDFLKQGVGVLRTWNGQMDREQSAPLITELLHATLAEMLVHIAEAGNPGTQVSSLPTKASPQAIAAAAQPLQEIQPNPIVIEHLLEQRPQGWVNDWDTLLINAFKTAMNAGRNQLGSPVTGWKYGSLFYWKIQHPIAGQVPVLNRFFNIPAAPMSGSGTTVKQTTRTLGPVMRMVVDFGNLEASVQNLATGESGHVASSHYKDQWNAYYHGTGFPMQFDRVQSKETLRITPQ